MKKPSAQRLREWRAARVQSYVTRYSSEALAAMVVQLEDKHNLTPEFEVDDEWPGRGR